MLINVAKTIKDLITMQEVCEAYGFKANRMHKALCPFHNDNHNSMHIYETGFYCFACGAHGDIIAFIQSYFNLSFEQAIRKLNADFNLRLQLDEKTNGKNNRSESYNIQYQIFKNKLNKVKEKEQQLKEKYNFAFNYFANLDKIISRTKISAIEDITEEYAHALKHIEFAKYQLDCAIFDLQKFQNRRQKMITINEISKYALLKQIPTEELSVAEWLLFYRLKDVYARFKANEITKQDGESLKNKALHQYEKEQSILDTAESITAAHAVMWEKAEMAASEYCKNPSIETADKLYEAIFGVKRKNK